MSFFLPFYCSYRGELGLEKDSVIAFESLLLEVGKECPGIRILRICVLILNTNITDPCSGMLVIDR